MQYLVSRKHLLHQTALLTRATSAQGANTIQQRFKPTKRINGVLVMLAQRTTPQLINTGFRRKAGSNAARKIQQLGTGLLVAWLPSSFQKLKMAGAAFRGRKRTHRAEVPPTSASTGLENASTLVGWVCSGVPVCCFRWFWLGSHVLLCFTGFNSPDCLCRSSNAASCN